MNLAWYARRLTRMSLAEVRGRVADAALKRKWRKRQVRDASADPLAIPDSIPPFKAALPSFDPAALPRQRVGQIIAAADRVLASGFQLFDQQRPDLALDPDWFLDPRSGRSAPQQDYAFDIDCRNVDRVGTIKHVWEPSRHHHLTLLASAYFLSQDARYAEVIDRQLRSWWNENPFLSGVHWTSGIELGVRLISWIWIRRLLDTWEGIAELFESNPVFVTQLHHHQDYLANLPSHNSSANNHIIAELSGQFAACCAFPYFPETDGWRDRAAMELCREIRLQTFDCGLNRELASSYHQFVLELVLAASIEGEAAGRSLGAEAWNCIAQMTDALAATVDGSGQLPRQGDSDDAHVLLLDDPDLDGAASALSAGATLFGSCSWWPLEVEADLRALLWSALAGSPEVTLERPTTRPNHLPDAGMAILRGQTDGGNEVWCRCDHGPHGYLSIAAHAHADALSVELRCDGVEILADPGTYTYQGEERWRAYFRSTLAHNCLEIGARDQSESGGPFMWTTHAKSELVGVRGMEGGPVSEWCAWHGGYGRLEPAARHTRTVRLTRATGQIVIEDKVESKRAHPGHLVFHLGPRLECRLNGRLAELNWIDDGRNRCATIRLPRALEWSAIRGQTDPPLGWYSSRFGHKQPTTTLLGAGRVGAEQILRTEIELFVQHQAAPGDCADKVVETDSNVLIK